MYTPSETELLERLMDRAPFPSHSSARAAFRATLLALGEELKDNELDQVAQALPQGLRHDLWDPRISPKLPLRLGGLDDFYERVAICEGVPLARAVEHAQVVCRVLAEQLKPTTVKVQRWLPHLAALFEAAEASSAPVYPEHRSSLSRHDLAEGRPGGTHPVASSDGQTLAHRHSVARSDNPHGDTKLSSSSGLSQERQGRTLASGRPGSLRPIADSH